MSGQSIERWSVDEGLSESLTQIMVIRSSTEREGGREGEGERGKWD